MRVASFIHNKTAGDRETSSYGLVSKGGIIDLGKRLGNEVPNLKTLLCLPHGLERLIEPHANATPDFDLTEIQLLPVVPNPSKILCVGLNYEMHRQETGRPRSQYPTIFARFAHTLIGHGQPIWRPHLSDVLDYEGELALIIGKAGRHIAPEDAFSHVAGYTCFNDASIRDWQNHSQQYTPGKNFPATGPLGPWMVTTDSVSDIEAQTLTTTLNGIVMQQDTISSMIFPIPEIMAYCSSFAPLDPGDVIATGTPGGVGIKRNPQVLMKPGDEVSVEITEIGTLTNTVIEEPLS